MRVVNIAGVVRIQTVDQDFIGCIHNCATFSFVALPCAIGKLLDPFLDDGFFIFNHQTLQASSLDRSIVINLPRVEQIVNLATHIFDVSTVSL